jgi:kynurenine 3-monooxygenase
MSKDVQISVVGAGLAGTLMALFLAKRGYSTDLYEVRPDLRKNVLPAGRSINMAMSERGIHALKEIGVFDQIKSELIPMKGRMIHSINGETYFQPYGVKEAEVNYSISRSKLNELLLDAAEKHTNLKLHFNHKCMEYDFDHHMIHFSKLDEKNREIKIKSPITIGADGAFSHIRRSMLRLPRFNFSQEYLDWGYKELTIPPGPHGKHRIETNALHIWPRTNFMLIALPNRDGSFTCTLFLPYEGDESFKGLASKEDIETFFEMYFPDAKKLMPGLVSDYEHNPIGSMLNIQCSPWNHKGEVVLLGDAAHSMTPFFGQGMNSSFEDCRILSEYITRSEGDFEKAFTAFSTERKKDTDAICQMSRENFIEMRDSVGAEGFKIKKQMEHDLDEMYSELYCSRYRRVSFSNEPYSSVYTQGLKNEKVLLALLEHGKNIKELDAELVKKVIQTNF